MASLDYIGQQFAAFTGLLIFLTGLLGSILQMIIFITTSTYRRTPCVFYFFIAALHDCGQLFVSLGPYVVTSFLGLDINRISFTWCRIRFFLTTAFSAIPLSCVCLATIDQFLGTCATVRLRRWSSMKVARWTSFCVMVFWWVHGALWIFFRELSPVTQSCVYNSRPFIVYNIFFIFFILATLHVTIMLIFACLCYRNIRKTVNSARLQIDRQMIRMVYTQAALTLIGLTPYGIFAGYLLITIDVSKPKDRTNMELFVYTITYTLCFLTYGVSEREVQDLLPI